MCHGKRGKLNANSKEMEMDDAKLLADCLVLQQAGGDVLARTADLARAMCARAQAQREDEQRLKAEWEQLRAERQQFASERESGQQLTTQATDRIVLDVGGKTYATTRATLCAFPTSMLAAWFSGRHAIQTREDGSVFIDRSPVLFEYVLDYLRTRGERALFPTEENGEERLKAEFEFYCLLWPGKPTPCVLDSLQGELECVVLDVGAQNYSTLNMDIADGVLLTAARHLLSPDKPIYLWDTHTGQNIGGCFLNEPARGTPEALCLSSDGKFVVGAYRKTDTENEIVVFNTQDGTIATTFACDVLPRIMACLSNSDVILSVSGHNCNHLSTYSVSTGQRLWTKTLSGLMWHLYPGDNRDVFVVNMVEGDAFVFYVYGAAGNLLYNAGNLSSETATASAYFVDSELRVVSIRMNELEVEHGSVDMYFDRWDRAGARLLNGKRLICIPSANTRINYLRTFNGPDNVYICTATTFDVLQLAFASPNSVVVSKQVSIRLDEPEYWGGINHCVCVGSVVAVQGADKKVKVWRPREALEQKCRRTAE